MFVVYDSENNTVKSFPTYKQAINYKNAFGNKFWKIWTILL